jgi:CheY-like chemotaxis protein
MLEPRFPYRKTILIVEDEPDTAEMLSEMMHLCGCQVVHTCRGHSSLEMILTTKPDALLLDVMLPDLSGLEVLRHIRRDPRLEQIPVILVSGNCHPSDIQEGMMAGASAYLTKPVSFWELKEALDGVTRKKAQTAGASV